MRRRWLVLIPGLLVTAGLIAAVIVGVPTKYQSQSTVELLNSSKGSVDMGDNPFLATSASLTGMADTLARNLNSDSSVSDLKVKGVTDPYVVMIADNAQAPLLWITITGTDQAAVLADDKTVTDYARDRLTQLQVEQNVPSNALIRMTTIVEPQNPVAQTKTKIEYLAMVGILGIVLSIFGTFFVEARRRPQVPVRPVGDDLGDGLGDDPAEGEEYEEFEEDEESPALSASRSGDSRSGASRSASGSGSTAASAASMASAAGQQRPVAPRMPRQPTEEVLNESTMQLTVLKLPDASRSDDDDQAVWFK
jgi:hypothetical protein